MKIFLPILLCCSLSVWAEQPLTQLTLVQAEQLWQSKNRELQLVQNQARSSAADKLTAAQKPNPILSFNTTSIETGQPAFIKRADSVVRIDQVFERGDKRTLRMREAALRTDAALADYADAKRQGRLDLYFHYYDLASAQEQLHIAAENAQLFAQSIVAARLRLKAGDLAGADLARLQVDALRAQNDVETAQNNLYQAQTALAYRIGMEQSAAQLYANDRWPDLESLDSPTSISAAIAKRPDVIAADKRAQAAEAAFAQAQALRTRDVTVGVQVEHNGQNQLLNSVGVGFSVPLMIGYAYAGEIEHARIDLESAQRIAEQTRAQANVEIGNTYADLSLAHTQVERFDQHLLQAAQHALDAAEFGYKHGAIPLMDLLDARRTYKSTQIEAVNARANYAKALSAWRFATEISPIDTSASNASIGANRLTLRELENR